MNESIKFWLQSLLIPAVLATVGFVINNTLQKQQRAFDKIKLTEQIINNAFDSNNPQKAMALASLIPTIVEDKAFADSLVRLINRTYLLKAEEALQQGDIQSYEVIADAAETFKGTNINVIDSLQQNPVANKIQSARQYEQKGLQQIQTGSLKEAQKNFEKAEKAYPGLHSAYEISKLLKDKVDELQKGADTSAVKREVINEIKKKYSWRLKDNKPSAEGNDQ